MHGTMNLKYSQITEHKENMRKYFPFYRSVTLRHNCLRCNGCKLHINSLCEMHGELDKLFGVEPLMFPHDYYSGAGSRRGGSKVLYCREM